MRLTFASFALLVAVDQQVARALGAEGQQDALQHSRQQSEAQQQRPQGGVAHDGFHSKDLQTANTTEEILIDSSQNPVVLLTLNKVYWRHAKVIR